MDAATNRLEFAPPPTPGVLRSFGLAMLAHAFLLAALTWGVQWHRETASVSAEAELWSSVPQQAAPKLVELPPKPPALAPTPPAPPQVQPLPPDPNIALERDKLRLKKEREAQRLEQKQQEKLKQEKLLLEKKRLQDKLERDKKAAEDKKKSEHDTQRKEAEARKEAQDVKRVEVQRQDRVKQLQGMAGASGGQTSTGTALHSSGPSASYAGRIRASIKPNIVFADAIAGNPTADVEVRTAPDGTIISRKLTKPSGVKSWDDAVLRAIDKTEKLPRDVDGQVPPVLEIKFRPKD